MFKAARKSALNTVEWDAKRLEYIEAWSFIDVSKKTPQYVREDMLYKEQVQDWLHHRNGFEVPDVVANSEEKPNGGLRLLICDRTSLFPPGFAMKKEDFVEAENVLHLHPATLPSFLVSNGTHSRYLQRDENGDVTRIDIVLKAPQKYEIANYGLSISFDVQTGWTTAFLYGESVTDTAWRAMGRNQPASETVDHLSWEYQSPKHQILKLLQQSTLPWNHPFLLPCALMADHLSRMRAFSEGELTKDVMDIERELGIVRVGARSEHGMSGLWPHFRPPHEEQDFTNALFDRPAVLTSMTIRINTQYTKVIFTKRSPNWSLETAEFLLNLWQKQLDSLYHTPALDEFLSEYLEYSKDVAGSIKEHVGNLQTRMDLQLNILYNLTAQRDTKNSAEIALSSGRDSVSMKILAFISALFLPATYVATLFSMQGLFNWVTDSGDGGEPLDVVNKLFWVYWAVSIPLTVITMVGWAWWWRYEMKRYPSDPSHPNPKPSTPPGFVQSIMQTLGWVPAPPKTQPALEKKKSGFVFGGRRRPSKIGLDGNPSAQEELDNDLLSSAEAGNVRTGTFQLAGVNQMPKLNTAMRRTA